jgi:ABC-type lipoprotein release transport system permease subunit
MNQSKLSSLYEALMNIVIGFTINYVINFLFIPLFVRGQDGLPVHIDPMANWWMGCAYTGVSLVRSYVIRRWFNARLHGLSLRLAGDQA